MAPVSLFDLPRGTKMMMTTTLAYIWVARGKAAIKIPKTDVTLLQRTKRRVRVPQNIRYKGGKLPMKGKISLRRLVARDTDTLHATSGRCLEVFLSISFQSATFCSHSFSRSLMWTVGQRATWPLPPFDWSVRFGVEDEITFR